MRGYRQSGPSDCSSLTADGRLSTGDLGHLDSDGELFITGRLKDLIIRGGVNISPRLLEDAFYRLDAVEEAAVVGIPHAVYGEEVAAAIKVKAAYRGRFGVEDCATLLRAEHGLFPASEVDLPDRRASQGGQQQDSQSGPAAHDPKESRSHGRLSGRHLRFQETSVDITFRVQGGKIIRTIECAERGVIECLAAMPTSILSDCLDCLNVLDAALRPLSAPRPSPARPSRSRRSRAATS